MALLDERIMALPAFQGAFGELVRRSIRSQFPVLSTEDRAAGDPRINFLLSCGTILAQSDAGTSQDAALRIAQYVISESGGSPRLRAASALILDTLANASAIRLARTRELLQDDFASELPLPLSGDVLRRRIKHTFLYPHQLKIGGLDERNLVLLNRFQQRVRESFDGGHESISFSAPTSAGKSFVVQRLVERELLTGSLNHVAFLVPTRALIRQTEQDLRESLQLLPLSEIQVTSIPQLPDDWRETRYVFVYTQERLFWMLREAPEDFSLDLVVADEAQKISEGSRGILLEQAIRKVALSGTTRFLFSCPLAENPGILTRLVAKERRKDLVSEYSAVNQNLLWASQVPRKPTQWLLRSVRGNKQDTLGSFSLSVRPTPKSKLVPLVAAALGEWSEGNLVYANGAAEAEKAAKVLAELLPEETVLDHEQLDGLAKLAARVIHPKYALVSTVEHGVGFHYGNLPSLLRGEIERLFRQGVLKYLVATSTLLEGVNLATRSIFVSRPRRGKGNPMSEMDFWNLAGRAGRLGSDFQGNVVCIEPEQWPQPPPSKRGRYKIRPSFDVTVDEKAEELLDYMHAGAPPKQGQNDSTMEYAVSYLMAEHVNYCMGS